jgi:ATP synthase F1 complex assembly factor 1
MMNAARAVPRRCMSFTYPSPRQLKDLVKIPLLAMETPHKITTVWRQRHDDDMARVGDVLPTTLYNTITSNSKQFPMFIFPVHRNNGFTVLVAQWQDKHCLFVGLEQFQKHDADAHPVVVLTFYDDFKDKKDIVLARFDITDPVVTKAEVQKLFKDVTHYYTTESGLNWVRDFNLRPQTFDAENFFRVTRPLN